MVIDQGYDDMGEVYGFSKKTGIECIVREG